MSGLFDSTPLERPVTCRICEKPLDRCSCPRGGADGEVLLPKNQPLRVSREQRRNGRTVTEVTGLDPVASNVVGILRQLQVACAAGGTSTRKGIEIQGDHCERVASILEGLGYPVMVKGQEQPRPENRRRT